MTAITAGSLVVEPFVAQSKLYGQVYACALCGEDRRQESHARRHRFRTSDDVSAQRYPLCEYCLGRVRATGDFTGFLRMVRDGLWRAKTDDEVKAAWEESVRLREKMFWARLGGGVIPVTYRPEPSPTNAQHAHHDEEGELASNTREISRTSEDVGSPVIKLQAPPSKPDDPFKSNSNVKRVSIGKSTIERPSVERTDSSTTVQDFATPETDAGEKVKAPSTPPMKDEQEEDGVRTPPAVSLPGGFE